MIPLSIPTFTGNESQYLLELMEQPRLISKGNFSKMVLDWFRNQYKIKNALLTKSCTDALELSALLIEIQPGDEVIMPSFTFVSTANAFVLRGGIPVFVDVDPESMNIDPDLVAKAITPKTRAIVAVHYAGKACDMEKLRQIANEKGLYLIEDAAQGILAKYQDQYQGTMGDLGCISFDQMKNITCGQGGILFINKPELFDRAEILFENGTNKRKFHRGEIRYYEWIGLGSNYKISELDAAFLYGQLQEAEKVIKKRVDDWLYYFEELKPLADAGYFNLPPELDPESDNGHVFFLKCKSKEARRELMTELRGKEILATFHYIPLHSTNFALSQSRFSGEDKFTTSESQKLLRLPIYFSISRSQQDEVVKAIFDFYEGPQK